MNSSFERRNYSLSDADLCMFASNLCNTLTRCLTDLADYGLDVGKIASLKALGDSFEVFPSDGEALGSIMIATEDKNEVITAVIQTIQGMALRVAMKWGENSVQYRSLGISGMSGFTEEGLLAAAGSVHSIMTDFLPDLTDTGLTVNMLNDFADLNESFKAERIEQAAKISERDSKTLQRIALGNELYALVSIYCEIGKRVYAYKNSAIYKQFIIYKGGPTGLPGKIKKLNYDAAAKVFTWDANPVAVTYHLQLSANSKKWRMAFNGAETQFAETLLPGKCFARARGVNDKGNGWWSDVLELSIPGS